VSRILAEIARVDAAKRPKAGSVVALLEIYNRSADFLELSRRVQTHYQRLLDEMKLDMEDVLLVDVNAAWVREMRDAWAPRGYRAANIRLSVLANALGPAIEDQDIKGDPFARLKRMKRPHEAGEANPIWEDQEVTAAIEDAIATGRPGLARVYAIGRYGGFRKGTICRIPRNARITRPDRFGEPERRIFWLTEKRLVLADKREDHRLTAVIERTPNRAWTLAYDFDGNAWKERALGHAVERHLARLAKAGKVRAIVGEDGEATCPLTLHGLRHSRGVELAESGASDAEIMAQLEHATERAAKIYRRQAQRRRLADSAQDRVDNVTKLPKRKRGKNRDL
jgi:integrase